MDSTPSGPHYTELSPYGQQMENAALNGDISKVQQLYDEAVQKATDMGRDKPEQLVKQLFQARDPLTRAFTHKLSADQLQTFMDKLSEDERAKVQNSIDNFGAAAAAIGANYTPSREVGERLSSSGSSSSSASAKSLAPSYASYTTPQYRQPSYNYGYAAYAPTTTLRRGGGTISRLRTPAARRVSLKRATTRVRRVSVRRRR
jgi:hypothetical protein